jgi:zinc transport system substrate-binding protein
VYSVNYPLAWAAEQLAGEYLEIVFPAPAGVDPAYWEPDLETITAYQQADLILLNGAGYEKWVARVSLPQNALLDTSRDFAGEYFEVDSGPVHSHGPEGDHSHGELAFTLWLDLDMYSRQVDAVAAALAQLLPDKAANIEQRRSELNTRLIELDSELVKSGQQLSGQTVLYSHPVYQYFDRRYSINGRALHWEPDQVLKDGDWTELDHVLAHHPARLMLWEDEPLDSTRVGLEERGVEVVVFPPMGNRPGSGNFLSNLQKASGALAEAAAQPPR